MTEIINNILVLPIYDSKPYYDIQQITKYITTRDQVLKIFDDVYNMVFNGILPIDIDTLRSKIVINYEKAYLGCTEFPLNDYMPNNIYLSLFSKTTGVKLAMTIAHELTHVYIRYKTVIDMSLGHNHDDELIGEEGLCELVGFYCGLFIKSKGVEQVHNLETFNMLETEINPWDFDKLSEERKQQYVLYRTQFLQIYNNYKNLNMNLLDYVNFVIESGGYHLIC